MRTIGRVIILLGLALLIQACATAQLHVAQEAPEKPPTFERIAVLPFANGVGSELPATASENVAGAIMATLQKDQRNPFRDVTSTQSHQPGELVVQGKILKYNPGSKAARFILIGLGAGSLELEVTLMDGMTGETLEQFSTSGAIMAGGVAGASMGIEDMVNSVAKRVVERLVRYGSHS